MGLAHATPVPRSVRRRLGEEARHAPGTSGTYRATASRRPGDASPGSRARPVHGSLRRGSPAACTGQQPAALQCASRLADHQLGGLAEPVVGVSWFEANAFCAWKSAVTGLTVRLPSENEWEAACVWRLQQLPVCEPLNSTESGFGGTIPVGATDAKHLRDVAVPKDLLGNSFEWMFDPYRPGDDVRKIVKGGSWRQERWRAHPAYRGQRNRELPLRRHRLPVRRRGHRSEAPHPARVTPRT